MAAFYINGRGQRFIAVLWGILVSMMPQAVSARDVPLWGCFETSVPNTEDYANPFTDVILKATFTRPDGNMVAFWGFYDGDGQGGQTGHLWKLRFMPDQLGIWRYICTFSDRSPGKAGAFRCIKKGAKPGPLGIDPQNRYWFRFADGSRKHLHGYYYHDYFSDFEAVWQERVRTILLADGYTLVMPMTWTRGPGTFGEVRQPIHRTYAWRTAGEHVDWSRFDLSTWKRVDERLRWASEHGLIVYVFDGFFPNTSYGAKVVPPLWEDLYLRYTLARHAPFWNVLWNVGAEVWKLYKPGQVKSWAAQIKRLDPWQHPISWHDQGQGGHLTVSERAAWHHSSVEADYAVLQDEWRHARGAYDFAMRNASQKPVFGCECNWEELDGQLAKPHNRTEVRRAIWGMSLAAGITMNADWTADYDPAHGQPLLRYGFGRARADVKRMNRFLSALPWWTMAPHTELISDPDDVCMACPGSHYVVYSETGATVTLDLAPGVYRGEWFNPLGGAAPATQRITAFVWNGGKKTFTIPTNRNAEGVNDWVLHLRQTADSTNKPDDG